MSGLPTAGPGFAAEAETACVETAGAPVSAMVLDPGFPQGPSPGLPDQSPSGGDHSDALRQLLDFARMVAATADDDREAAQLEKVTTIVAGLLADQQRQAHDLLKGKLPPAAMIKALGG